MTIPVLPPDLIAIADAFEPDIRRRFIEAVLEAERWFPLDEMAAALSSGASDLDRILDLISLIVQERFRPSLIPLIDSLADIATQVVTSHTMFGQFDLVNPRTVTEIRERGAVLIDNVTDGVKESVRRVVGAGWSDGIPVEAQARMIRQVVGLDNRQTTSYINYKAGLEDQALPSGYVEHLTDQYRRRMLTQRAERISRTETIRASMAAQVGQWRELAEVGVLQGDRTKLVWQVTDDDRLCPYCAPMDEVTVDLFDEQFVSNLKGFRDGFLTAGKVPPPPSRDLRPDPFSQPRDKLGRYITQIVKGAALTIIPETRVDHPPLHPQCRCTLVLRFQD